MNQVSLVGRLTKDPELKGGEGEKAVCVVRIAVNNPGRGGKAGEPTYVNVATFGGQAKACAAHLAKGRKVAVSGKLVFREWTGRDGRKRSAHSVHGRVEFLGRPQVGGADGATDDTEERELVLPF